MRRAINHLFLLILCLIPTLAISKPEQLSLSLDALGDAVLSPSGLASPLGVGLDAGVHYRLPDAPFLSLGLDLGFNAFLGGSGMQTSWLDIGPRFFPFGRTDAGEGYAEAGIGTTLLGGVLDNHWHGRYHGELGIGYLLAVGGNQSLDLGVQYDYFDPTAAPLQDLAVKLGWSLALDQEAPLKAEKPRLTLFTRPRATPTIEAASLEPTPTSVVEANPTETAPFAPTPMSAVEANPTEAAPTEPSPTSVAEANSTSIPQVSLAPGQGMKITPQPTMEPVLGSDALGGPDETIPAKLTALVYFGYNQSKVTSWAAGRINELGGLVAKSPGDWIILTGFADDAGDPAHNLELSKQRAEAVKTLLVQQGIPGNKVMTSGKGSAEPVSANDTPEGRAENRRVEIKVLKSSDE